MVKTNVHILVKVICIFLKQRNEHQKHFYYRGPLEVLLATVYIIGSTRDVIVCQY